jgi:predicted dehydrogenase
MLTNKFEIGVIGAGHIASTIHLPLLSCLEIASVKYVADVRHPGKLASYYKTVGIEIRDDLTLLPDCDVVLLATPVGVRERYIREFSKRGTAIFSEKPFAVDLESHKRCLELTDRVTCNYMRTCYSSIRQLKAIVSSEIFGKLKAVYVSEGGIQGATGIEKEHYRTNVKLSGGGVLMETGCHTLSQLTYVLEDYEVSVYDAELIWQGDLDVHAKAHLHVSGDKEFDIKLEIGSAKPLKNVCLFAFDNTIVEFDHTDPNSTLRLVPVNNTGRVTLEVTPNSVWARTPNQAHYLKWRAFLEKLLRKEDIDTKSETSVDTTRIMTEIYKKGSRRDSV